MINPFPYENIANKKTFYGRIEELKFLRQNISNSTNVLLFSKRRMGKSTLISNLFNKIKKDYYCIYIDIYNMITAEDFAKLLFKGITEVQKGDVIKTIKSLSKLLRRVRLEPTFNSETSEMSIRTIVNDLTFDELMEDAFKVLFELSKDKKVVLAIDEFQQVSTIKDIKIDAILRKYIQKSENISYIFLGSKRNLLNSLFMYKEPLFEMATPYALKSIDIDEIYNYAKHHLKINRELIAYIFSLADGETKLIQMLLYRLYINYKNKLIKKDLIENELKEILILKNEHYKTLFDLFSMNQKKAFKLLSRFKKDLFTQKVLKEENLSRASMQSSLKSLYEKEFIDKEDDNWFIPDRTLELWGERILNMN